MIEYHVVYHCQTCGRIAIIVYKGEPRFAQDQPAKCTGARLFGGMPPEIIENNHPARVMAIAHVHVRNVFTR